MPPGTQIGIACELRWKPGGAVPELTMDGGPRIRAGLGDRGFSDLHHPAFCNPLPAARDGPLTDGAASEQRQIDLICMPQLTSFREKIAAPIGSMRGRRLRLRPVTGFLVGLRPQLAKFTAADYHIA